MLMVPVKIFNTREDFNSFIENEKEWMFNRIVNAIKFAITHGYDEANILEAEIDNISSNIVINSTSNEWDNSLKLALKWHESQENYEECERILSILKQINK